MTMAEKAFDAWYKEESVKWDNSPPEGETEFYLRIFEAGWRAAESRYWCGHKPTKQTPTATATADNSDE